MSSDPHTNRPPPTRLRRFGFRLASAFFGLVIGLLIMEVALRIIGYSSPEFYVADEALGYKLIPGMTGWYSKEGRSFVEINAAGFRDVEHTVEKPADVFRIAVIGDSYVEALQVERDQMFSNFVAEGVNGCKIFGPPRVEVLTFGVSGYGTAQELLLLREKVLRYSPDIVILAVTTNNDITDNLRELKNTPIPYFRVEGETLVADNSFRDEAKFKLRNSATARLGIWLKNHLRFIQAIGQTWLKIKYWYKSLGEEKNETPPAAAAEELAAPQIEVGIDNQIYLEPAGDNWRRAWQVTEALILQMRSEVEQSGAKFAVVTASNGVQVLPTVEERRRFASMLSVPDLHYPDRRIADFCKANSIPVINLSYALGEYAARENANLHGFEGNLGYGHWNQLGHRVAGGTIAQKFCGGLVR